MPPIATEACEVGHVAPAWTEAARALESPTEGRCVEGSPLADRRWVWSLCGGLPLHGRVSAPAICPIAPGGLAVKRVSDAPANALWGAPDAAVLLDCPGRYVIAQDGAVATVTLAATGPSACGPTPSTESVAGWPQEDPTGLAILPILELPPEVVRLLPEPLRAGGYADAISGDDALSGTAIWKSGPFPLRVAGFDLTLGRSTAWQALRFVVDAGAVSLSLAPVRLRVRALNDTLGAPVELATWARLGWSATRSWIDESLPVRLPASRACGARIAAGTVALLQTGDAPTSERACRRAPSTPPDTVYIGPDWVWLDWDVAPASLRTAKPRPDPDWRWEPDNGCDIVCR